jgi:hypothetical protein
MLDPSPRTASLYNSQRPLIGINHLPRLFHDELNQYGMLY